jgi:hypothetical protein
MTRDCPENMPVCGLGIDSPIPIIQRERLGLHVSRLTHTELHMSRDKNTSPDEKVLYMNIQTRFKEIYSKRY